MTTLFTILAAIFFVAGAGWAYLGYWNVCLVIAGPQPELATFAAIFNVLCFVFPGLLMMAGGAFLARFASRKEA